MKLRRAKRSELANLSALCLRSKAMWGYDADFLAACKAELTISQDELADSLIQVAEDDGIIAGLAQVRLDGRQAELEKLYVDPAAQSSGVGRRLFLWATDTCRAGGTQRMLIDADPGAAPFYRKMGARPDGQSPSGSIPGRMLPRLVFDLSTADRLLKNP